MDVASARFLTEEGRCCINAYVIGQAAQSGAQQTAQQLSDAELGAISGIVALVLVMALAFVAYAIKGQQLKDIASVGTFTVIGQLAFTLVVIYVVALLMLKKTIDSDAGLPILAGLAGVIVGKARGGGTVSNGGPGRGRAADETEAKGHSASLD